MRLPIMGPAYDTGIPAQNKQRLVNWYLEQDKANEVFNPELGQNIIMRPTPGMKTFSTLGTDSTVRGAYEHQGTLYAVGDNTLYTIASDGTETSKGTLNPTAVSTSEPVIWASSSTEIVIIDRNEAYVYNISGGTVSKISDADFPSSPEYVTYLDGYFIVTETNSEKFYISASNDATSWNALDFASANSTGDYLIAALADHHELWLFGDKSVEIWVNTGNVDFPFERRPGVLLTKGVAARRTIVQTNNSIYWLAKDESGQNLVVRAEGFTPVNVANQAIAAKINSYSTVDDAIAYVHREGVHEFYVLTFPTENVTWVFDAATGQWHERQSHNGLNYGRHKGNGHAFAHGKSLVADYDSNNLYEYDEDTYKDGSDTLRRLRISPALYTQNELTSLYNFQLDFEHGVGLESGQGSAPQVMLQVSKDGGHTFGPELWRDIGPMGTYNIRTKWDFLGAARDWMFRIEITDPVNAVVLGATADVG